MTLKIAICDDCEKDRKHMIQLLLRYAFARECDFHIEEFQNGKELQKQVTDVEIQKLMYDVLLDMEHNKTLVSIIDGYKNEYIVNINDIYYLETVDAKNKELAFHLKDKTIHAKGILSTWSSSLHEHAFHVCSRTVLVNLTHIHFFNGLDVILDNGEKISASKRNKKILVSQYLNQVVAIKRGGLHT